jgi:hypothetical protein
MAHFAKVLDGKVTQVIVAEPEFFETFIDSSPGQWLQTSYNTKGGVHYNSETKEPSEDQSKALRYNFAGVGHNYNAEADAFYAGQTSVFWVLNTETYEWEPPYAKPEDGQQYKWSDTQHDETGNGWVVRNSSTSE